MSSRYLFFFIVLLHLSQVISAQRRPPRDYGIELPDTRKINITQLLAVTERPSSNIDPEFGDRIYDVDNRPQTSSTRRPRPSRIGRRPFIDYRRPGLENDRNPTIEEDRRPTLQEDRRPTFQENSRPTIEESQRPARQDQRIPQGIIIFASERDVENQGSPIENSEQTDDRDKYRKKNRVQKVKNNQRNKLKGQHDREGLVRWPALRVSE